MDGVTRFGDTKSLTQRLRDGGIEIALETLHSVDVMGRMQPPDWPITSDALRGYLKRERQGLGPPVGQDLKPELERYNAVRIQRSKCKAENERRLRSLLWAEAKLREAGREEWTVLREFNGLEWRVEYPASFDYADREAQLMAALYE